MPRLFGNHSLPENTLKADKKACEKIGPLGMGRRALYLNSFYISRMYYTVWTDIRRVYKMVAMSKGGFTGIGAFGSMSYLVVELRDGRIKRCQIKYENQVDEALAWIAKHHPEIPTQSEQARKKLQEAEGAEKARYKKELTENDRNNIRILEEAVANGHKFEFPVSWGMDLASEHERYLVEEHFKRPVIMINYPKDIKAFYMKINDDDKTVQGTDVLFPQIGEIIGGSVREENYDKLMSEIHRRDIPMKDMWWYLDTRKYGTCPHGGFGLGFERLILFVTGMQNSRDVIPFPRTPKSAEF